MMSDTPDILCGVGDLVECSPSHVDGEPCLAMPAGTTSNEPADMDTSAMDTSDAEDTSMLESNSTFSGECGTAALEEDELENMYADLSHNAATVTPQSLAGDMPAADAQPPLLDLHITCTAPAGNATHAEVEAGLAHRDAPGADETCVREACRRAAQETLKYKSELEAAWADRRRLHNCIQEMKGNIRVFCRVRPSTQDSSDTAVECRKGGQILTVDLPAKGIDRNGQPRKADQKTYSYDAVFGPSASQSDVYAEVSGMVDSTYDGYHCTVIAYGQTGSGKTFTMQGSTAEPGISGRALGDIFMQKLRREAGGLQRVTVSVSMIEVYNEAFRDLLHEDQVKPRVGAAAIGGKIEVRESSSGVVSIHGATSVEVVTAEDVEGVSRRGLANRAVASTKSNDRSSRSHMVLMIDVEVRERASQSGEGGCVISSGRLSLVDLAGSERISKSEAAGLALTEAKHINKSLSALIDVMSALSERDRKDKASAAVQIKTGGEGKAAVAHIPFRNSKLTHLLMGSLKPGSKLVFITQVSPETDHVNETCNTLEFGSRAKGLDLGKTKQSAAKAVSLENAERHNEQLARELDRSQQACAVVMQESRALKVQLATAVTKATELEQRVASVQHELHGNIIRNGNLEEKLAEMEKKMSSLVSLNQSLSEKNMKLKDKEGRLAAQLVEAQREVRLPQKRRAEGAAVAEEGGSSRAALAHIHISDNENRLEDYEAAAIKKKRVYFEASSECTSGPATAEVENHVPVDDLSIMRKSRVEELARWKLLKSSAPAPVGGILDSAPDANAQCFRPSLMTSGSIRRFGGTESVSRTKPAAGRSAMGLGLPSRVFDSSSASSGLSSNASRRVLSGKK